MRAHMYKLFAANVCTCNTIMHISSATYTKSSMTKMLVKTKNYKECLKEECCSTERILNGIYVILVKILIEKKCLQCALRGNVCIVGEVEKLENSSDDEVYHTYV